MDTMTWWIIGIGIGIPVLVFTKLRGVWRRICKIQEQNHRILASGMSGRAKILNLTKGGMTLTVGAHRYLQHQLLLEVTLDSGPPYQTQTVAMVSESHIQSLQIDSQIKVMVDASNPQKVAVDLGPDASAYGVQKLSMIEKAKTGISFESFTPLKRPRIIVIIVLLMTALSIGGYWVAVNVYRLQRNKTDKTTMCRQATACCEKIAEKDQSGTENNCGDLNRWSKSACEQSLNELKKAARAQGISCE
jgi:hypothetical protein